MATRGGRRSETDAFGGFVRSLYSAGLALVAVGFVGTVLGWASVLEATGSVARSTSVATNAVSGAVLGTGTESAVVHAGTLAVVAGIWLLGVALIVDGLLDA